MTEYLWTDNEWTFPRLEKTYEEIEKIGVGEYGLDIYRNQFEIVSSEQMLDCYASIGLPIMYNHWSFGKRFAREQKGYKKGYNGLAYELVINSNPCINYLMEDSTMTTQALVQAHAAIGHNFVFKNNYLFKTWTDADSIVDYMSFARDYIAKIENSVGQREVELFLDSCHALKNYGVDQYKHPGKISITKEKERQAERQAYVQSRIDEFYRILPKKAQTKESEIFPKYRQENILYMCEKYAPNLKDWQREVIRIVRKIEQYFYPQRFCQMLHEGAACLQGDSLIETQNGLITIKELVDNKLQIKTDSNQNITNWFVKPNTPRIKLITDKGFIIHGGTDHKLNIDGVWKELNQFKIGDVIPVKLGNENSFAKNYIKLNSNIQTQIGVKEFFKNKGISYTTAKRAFDNPNYNPKNNAEYKKYFEEWIVYKASNTKKQYSRRNKININILDENLAEFLGLQIGDGSIQTHNGKNRSSSYTKTMPPQILQSPKSVIAAFLRGHFDTDGSVSEDGNIILSSNSVDMLRQEQQVLLNFNIFSSVTKSTNTNPKDNTWRLTICGYDNKVNFLNEIGFRTERKQSRLKNNIDSYQQLHKSKTYELKIIDIQYDIGTTYDFTVENTHTYRVGPFVNHNCTTHYNIMNRLYEKGLVHDAAMIEFFRMHSSVVNQPSFDNENYSGINPYKLGFEMFADVKRMCETPTEEDKHYFKHLAGENFWDVFKDIVCNYRNESFVRQYMSPKLVRDFRFFNLEDDKSKNYYLVTDIQDKRGYETIKDKIGRQYELDHYVPQIEVEEITPKTRTLRLVTTIDMKKNFDHDAAKDVLKHLKVLWGGHDVELRVEYKG